MVANYYGVESRNVVSNAEEMFVEFSLAGVEATFAMSKRGLDYGEHESLEDFKKEKKFEDIIVCLKPEYQNMAHYYVM